MSATAQLPEDCSTTPERARHARIKRILGLYFVSDLESANGTFVNGQRVLMAQLNDGDQIRVGSSTLKFVTNHHEAEYSRRLFTLATVDPLTGAHNKRRNRSRA